MAIKLFYAEQGISRVEPGKNRYVEKNLLMIKCSVEPLPEKRSLFSGRNSIGFCGWV